MRSALCWYCRAREAISLRDGGGEQQGAAGFGRRAQDEFQFVLEAEVEHLVGFVEHDGFAFVEL